VVLRASTRRRVVARGHILVAKRALRHRHRSRDYDGPRQGQKEGQAGKNGVARTRQAPLREGFKGVSDFASVQPGAVGSAAIRRRLRGRPRKPSRQLVARRTLALVVAAAIPFYLGVRDGGYDVVVRQEFGVVLFAVLVAGLSLGVLPRGRLSWEVVVPLAAVTALAALTALSLLWTGSAERTLAEVARVLVYGGIVALALLALNRYTWRSAGLGLGVAAAGVCVVALASRIAPSHFTDPVVEVLGLDRLSYPLGYWNAVAAWGAMTVAMGVAWSTVSRSTRVRAAALAAVPVGGLTVYLTYSRGGAAAAALGVFAAVALARHRWTAAIHAAVGAGATGLLILVTRGEPQIAHATGSAGAGAVALAVLAVCVGCAIAAVVTQAAQFDRLRLPSQVARVVVPATVLLVLVVGASAGQSTIHRAIHQFETQQTFTPGVDPASRLTSGTGNRKAVWDAALHAAGDHPAGGIGPGTFEFWWARHGVKGEFLRDAHSLYLEQLAELGVPGFAVLVAFLGSLLLLALRARRYARRSTDAAAAAALCAAGIVFLFHAGVDWLWEETAVGVLGLGSLAVAIAGLSDRRPERLRWGPQRAVLAGAGVVAMLILIPGLVSAAREGQSEAALRAGDAPGARSLADQAVAAASWSATPYQQRAAAEDAEGKVSAARADLLQAAQNEPVDWRQPLQLAQIDVQVGKLGRARRDFARAERLNRVALPIASFGELRRAVSPRCLLLGPVQCVGGQYTPPSACQPVPDSVVQLIGATTGAGFGRAIAVRSLAAARPTFYIAAQDGGVVALWAVGESVFTQGQGIVVPLTQNAREATPGTIFSPTRFGVGADDVDAHAADACLSIAASA
jgi:O-antigen ligase/polysaccharide polymerase Wzy-like membrane protein